MTYRDIEIEFYHSKIDEKKWSHGWKAQVNGHAYEGYLTTDFDADAVALEQIGRVLEDHAKLTIDNALN